jgi:hypothetical protein
MPLTAEQIRLAVLIDTHVREVLAPGGGDAALLMSMADSMGPFKEGVAKVLIRSHRTRPNS